MGIRQFLSKQLYPLSRREQVRYLAELDELQWLPRETILQRQQNHLQEIVTYAYQHVPYYRDLFDQVGFHPSELADNPASFQKIPYLTKKQIQANKERLVTTDPAINGSLTWVKTGGTTGEPLWFAQDARYRVYNSAHDYQVMTWSGWRLGDPQFWLWGHVPDSAPRGLAAQTLRLKDWLVRRFDSNAFIMSEASLTELAQQIQANPHGVLWSYVSTAYRFAQFVAERGYRFNLRAVFTAAEPLFEHQRGFIEQSLGCPVFNCYSSIDTGDVACESPAHDGLLIQARNCYVEVINNGQHVVDDAAGEFIITNLINRAMPMIRYQIEDWGIPTSRLSPCGRGLPMLEKVEGRKIDLFQTRQGHTVYGAFAKDLMPLFENVKQFQVVQKSLDLVIFRIVSDGPLDGARLQQVETVTQAALGDNVTVQFDFVDSLPQSPTGKHRYLVSEIGSQSRDAG